MIFFAAFCCKLQVLFLEELLDSSLLGKICIARHVTSTGGERGGATASHIRG